MVQDLGFCSTRPVATVVAEGGNRASEAATTTGVKRHGNRSNSAGTDIHADGHLTTIHLRYFLFGQRGVICFQIGRTRPEIGYRFRFPLHRIAERE